MAAPFSFDIETTSASCLACHVSALDITSRQQAGEWHAAHQRRCTPTGSRTVARVLEFPADRSAVPADTTKEAQNRG